MHWGSDRAPFEILLSFVCEFIRLAKGYTPAFTIKLLQELWYRESNQIIDTRDVRERRDRDTRAVRTGEKSPIRHGGYYEVRVMLIFLFELSSSTCVVGSPGFWPLAGSRGRLLPKEKTLQRSPAPDLHCFTTAGVLCGGVLGFERQIVKY